MNEQNDSAYPFQNWQPNGCLLRNYDGPAVEKCLQNDRSILFFGDSTVRRLFWSIGMLLNETKAIGEGALFITHMNLNFVNRGTALHFIWDPFFNSSLVKALPDYMHHLDAGSPDDQASGRPFNNALHAHLQSSTAGERSMPSSVLAVVGGGLWYAKDYIDTEEAIQAYKQSIDALIMPFEDSSLRRSSASKTRSNVLIMPPEPPIYEMMQFEQSQITAEKIDTMNEYLQSSADSRGFDVLQSFTTMATQTQNASAWELDGLHNSLELVRKQAEVILNVGCNNYHIDSPHEGTCCYAYPRSWVQMLLLAVGLVICIFTLSVEYLGKLPASTTDRLS